MSKKVQVFLHGAVKKEKSSDRLKREYDNSAVRNSAGKLFRALVAAAVL